MSIRLPGLSGYDFSAIVQSMVDVYSLPKVKMAQQQTKLQTQQNAWRDVKTRLSALENTLNDLRKADTWTAKKATSSKSDLLAVSGSPDAVNGVYNVKVVSDARAQTVAGIPINVEKADSATSISAGSFSIKVGEQEKTVNVKAGASLKEIADSINNAEVGVTASVIQIEEGKYALTVVANKTGEANKAVFADLDGGKVLGDLGILDSSQQLNETQAAKDAEIEVNGIKGIKSATNTFSHAVPGLTLTVNGVDPETVVKVTVSSDYAVAQQKIQSFINQYNSVQSFISTKMSYNKELGTKGDLFGDPILQGIQERLRRIVTSSQDNPTGPFNLLSEIGITTSADNFGKDGTLVFNVEEFKKAMEENPQSVANLFGAPAGGVTPRTEKSDAGLTQGLANILKEYLTPMVQYQGSLDKIHNSLGDQIEDVKERIDAFNDRIAAYQERVTLRFSRLESTLAQLSSQSSWLDGQLTAMYAQLSANKK